MLKVKYSSQRKRHYTVGKLLNFIAQVDKLVNFRAQIQDNIKIII